MKAPWKNRLITKFFLSYLTIILLLFAFFHIYSGSILKSFYVAFLAREMAREARLVNRLIPGGSDPATRDSACRRLSADLESRVTIIAPDGLVLCDSDHPSRTMENHRDRPEVTAAVLEGEGRSLRRSATLGKEMLYQAVLLEQGGKSRVIRLSVPLDTVESTITAIRRSILGGLLLISGLGLLLSLYSSNRLSSRIGRMLAFSQQAAKGHFPGESIRPLEGDELGALENNLNEMSRSIQEKIKEITDEKEKAESILRCMIEGLLVVDTQGRLILLNENAQKIFRVARDRALQGASLMEISRHPEMKRLVEELLGRRFSREPFTKEVTLDEERSFRVNAASLADGEGRPLGHILVFHDVTELKRLEHVRADFVANVSHELRTPVTAIRGYAETLLRNPPGDPADAEQFLGVIHRHSERLGRLIDDLLALSDLETGKIRLVRERVTTADLIGNALELFEDQAKKKGLTLSSTIEPGTPPVLGDPDRLQQLLINLIDNAVKYTPSDGYVKLTASPAASADDPAAPMVEIAVADTGSGIPESDLPRLTERFYRVDKARSRELGGTGLGLAIVKHIVQAHAGAMRIESRVQKGTTVRVFLPAGASRTESPEVRPA